MKKIISIVLCLVMVLSVFAIVPFEVGAEEVDKSNSGEISGDYEYSILEDGTAEITSYKGSDSELFIPNYLDEYMVTSIDGDAFYGNTNLVSVTLPSNLSKISQFGFNDCLSLKSIYVDKDNNKFSSIDGVLFNKEQTKLIRYPENKEDAVYTIPYGVLDLGIYAFNDSVNLTSIIFPKSMKSLRNGLIITGSVFYHCKNLTSAVIPNSVTNMPIRSIGYTNYSTKTENFTIYGSKGFESERYAKANGFNFIEDDSTSDIEINYKSWLGDDNHRDVKVPIKWTWDHFFDDSTNGPNIELAKAGIIASRNAEVSQKDAQNTLKDLSFSDLRSNNYSKMHFAGSPAYTFGYKYLEDENTYIFSVINRGTDPFSRDLKTDVIGASLTGFRLSALNTYNDLVDYMKDLTNLSTDELKKANLKFFVTGHSLGGAVTNVLCKYLEEYTEPKNIFGYSFASPCTTNLGDLSNGIYNYLYNKDMVAEFGLKFGTLYGYNIRFDNSTISKDKFVSLTQKNLTDFSSFIDYHSTDIYLSHLLSIGDDYTHERYTTYYYYGGYSVFACPVDVKVLDSNNNVIGEVKNNVVSESIVNDDIDIVVVDDVKYIFSNINDIKFEVTGYDEGTMDYSVCMNSPSGGKQIKQFTSVPVEKDKKYFSDTKTDDVSNVLLSEYKDGKLIAYLTGDANGDYKVSINDATVIQLYLAGLLPGDILKLNLADADHDKDVSVTDVTFIQQYLASIRTYL